MDVRCEKCNTEYELDEARLKPGGVTVKCTTCGHMFKIRKRSPTQGGIPVVRAGTASAPPPPRAPTAPAPRGPTPAHGVPQPRAQTGSGPVTGGEGERNWILRLDNGETRQCRELGILQQWIITGLVSRESMISRSGKTWKRLGDIAELSSFFVVADEARDVRAQRESGQITPPRGGPPAPERETVVEPVRGTGTGRHAAPPPAPRATTTGPAVAPARPATATPPPPPRPAAAPPA
ncbi:MAG: zinc-ribbon domain-containing protein, partial [Myxococcales bacterium]|nr:zinc-ribbon domain-containing protein [Myxococcales bacterium]